MLVDVLGESGTVTFTWSILSPTLTSAYAGYGAAAEVHGYVSYATTNTEIPLIGEASVLIDANGMPQISEYSPTYSIPAGWTEMFLGNTINECSVVGCAGWVSGGAIFTPDPVPLPSSLLLFATIIVLGNRLLSFRNRPECNR